MPSAAQFSRAFLDTARLKESRARVFRYPPGTRGRRHQNQQQEEVFVVLEGTLTMLLGDEPERVDLPPKFVIPGGSDAPPATNESSPSTWKTALRC